MAEDLVHVAHQGRPCDPPIIDGVVFAPLGDPSGLWVGACTEEQAMHITRGSRFTRYGGQPPSGAPSGEASLPPDAPVGDPPATGEDVPPGDAISATGNEKAPGDDEAPGDGEPADPAVDELPGGEGEPTGEDAPPEDNAGGPPAGDPLENAAGGAGNKHQAKQDKKKYHR